MTATARALIEQEHKLATDTNDLESLCLTLADFRELRRTIAVMEDDLSDLIAQQVHVHREVDGIGIVEVKKGANRKAWDHDRLTELVTARALDERKLDENTGEYERESEAVARALRDCAGFSYWKVTGLRKRGIDPDEYCETSPGRVSVILP